MNEAQLAAWIKNLYTQSKDYSTRPEVLARGVNVWLGLEF